MIYNRNFKSIRLLLSTKQNITFVVLLQIKRPFCIPTFMKIYYFKTYFENIDIKIYDALIVLLLEAKLAYEYFCEGCKDNEVTELLALANYQATEKLMMLND